MASALANAAIELFFQKPITVTTWHTTSSNGGETRRGICTGVQDDPRGIAIKLNNEEPVIIRHAEIVSGVLKGIGSSLGITKQVARAW